MSFGCLCIAGVGFVVVLFGLVSLILGMVRRALTTAADRVAYTAAGMASQAMNRVVDRGAMELVQGAKDLGKSINEDMKRKDPKWVEVQINGLAHRNKGEVTIDRVISELSVTNEMASSVLEGLVEKHVCFLKDDAASPVKTYIFPGFKEKREIKLCEYCNSVFMPEEAESQCLHCGAPLTHTTTMA
jgi:hypothetical protein